MRVHTSDRNFQSSTRYEYCVSTILEKMRALRTLKDRQLRARHADASGALLVDSLKGAGVANTIRAVKVAERKVSSPLEVDKSDAAWGVKTI